MEQRVLVVDNDEDHRKVVVEIVERHFPTLTAASGEEAMQILEAEKALHAVLSDFKMHLLTGADVLQKTRQAHPKAHRALMSSKIGDVKGFEQLVKAACDPHVLLPKPLTLERLRTVLQSWKELS